MVAPADGGIYRLVEVVPPNGHGAGLRCDECGRVIKRDAPLVLARIRDGSISRFALLTRWFHWSCWMVGGPERRARRAKEEARA